MLWYDDYALDSILKENISYNDKMLNNILMEAAIFEKSLNVGIIDTVDITTLLEATDNTKSNFIDNIMEFFKNLFNSFITKNKAFIEANKKWLADNTEKLKSKDYKGIEIEMVPFWVIKPDEIINTMNSIANTKPSGSTRDEFIKSNSILKSIVGEQEIKPALQKYFRVGKSSNLDKVKVSGSQLKNTVETMLSFVTEYDKYVDKIQAMKNKYNTELTQLKNISKNPKPTNESFSLLENTIYKESRLISCYNYDLIFEADTKTTDTRSVSVVNNNKTDDKKDTPVTNKGSNNPDEFMMHKVYIQTNQLVVSTAMSAIEERYVVYMKALKQLASEK
jgi:hypothetical protein